MQNEIYDFIDGTAQHQYFFESVGTKGIITKLVIFHTSNSFEYNLSLCDFDRKTGEKNYETPSNNGDMNKVLSTVFHIAIQFLKNRPNDIISFYGNHPTKQKLYQRIIRNNLEDLTEFFEVYGVNNVNHIEVFDKNTDYKGFSFILKRT